MIFKLSEPSIADDNPFANCKLHRKKYGEALMSIVSACQGGAVIALDGAWGTGKTTFVKMWQKMLDKHEFKTIYYNAWETDFIDDPLLGLVGELSSIFKSEDAKEKLKTIFADSHLYISFAKSILKTILPIMSDGETLDKLTSVVKDFRNNFFTKELEDYNAACDL